MKWSSDLHETAYLPRTLLGTGYIIFYAYFEMCGRESMSNTLKSNVLDPFGRSLAQHDQPIQSEFQCDDPGESELDVVIQPSLLLNIFQGQSKTIAGAHDIEVLPSVIPKNKKHL